MTKTLSPSTPASSKACLLPPIPFRNSGDTLVAPHLVLAVYPAPFFFLFMGGTALLKNLPFKLILTSFGIKFQIFLIFATYRKFAG